MKKLLGLILLTILSTNAIKVINECGKPLTIEIVTEDENGSEGQIISKPIYNHFSEGRVIEEFDTEGRNVTYVGINADEGHAWGYGSKFFTEHPDAVFIVAYMGGRLKCICEGESLALA